MSHFDADRRLVIWLASVAGALIAALAAFGLTDMDDARTNETIPPAVYQEAP